MMHNTVEKILSSLRASGHRVTKVRESLVGIFTKQKLPITASELLARLAKQGQVVNKTTVYRELAFLVDSGLIQTVSLQSGVVSYELAAQAHHHHVVCRQCHTVVEVELASVEQLLTRANQTLSRRTGFRDVDHQLEFYGLCGECV